MGRLGGGRDVSLEIKKKQNVARAGIKEERVFLIEKFGNPVTDVAR